uniref:Ribosomal-protein-serine acetyltransferase n=1 Tax=Thermosporothrix sp. COM3 TaxID=2490863 RepID=A0A455SGM6_9CHLR|nr:ribosomal-protein-serine acetyltransferase [Thermosporothrix sp. COM3]
MFTWNLDGDMTLQVLELRHAPEFLAFVQENRAYLAEWLGWADEIRTIGAARAFIQHGLTSLSEGGLPRVGIWLDGRLVGGILFFPVDPLTRATEVGYWLGRAATGRGVMTRALKAMLHYAFDLVGVNRVGLQADVRNSRSRAVAERLDFTFEGVRRQSWQVRGELCDMATYSLLAAEWRERSQS